MQLVPLALSIASIVGVALLSDFSLSFAALAGTAPLSSALAYLQVRSEIALSRTPAEQQHQLVLSFARELVKGVFAALIFAVALWVSTAQRFGGYVSLVVASIAWGVVWSCFWFSS